ncbi:hypothetical protein B0O99DRAFT_605355 [Bisporella sp. PMI_857]|nr:hypothetical protein B0O99DRAFT_605355 [Bisporella sp. PMI_857]
MLLALLAELLKMTRSGSSALRKQLCLCSHVVYGLYLLSAYEPQVLLIRLGQDRNWPTLLAGF